MTIIRPEQPRQDFRRPATEAEGQIFQGQALDLAGIVGSGANGAFPAALALMRPGAGQRITDAGLPTLPITDNGQEIAREVRRSDNTFARTFNNGLYMEFDEVNGQRRLLQMRMPGPGGDTVRLTYNGNGTEPTSVTDGFGRTIHAGGPIVIQVGRDGQITARGMMTDSKGQIRPYNCEWDGANGTRTEYYPGGHEVSRYSVNAEGGLARPLPAMITTTYDDTPGGLGVQTRELMQRSDGFGTVFSGDPRTLFPQRPGQPAVPPLGDRYTMDQTIWPSGTFMSFTDQAGLTTRIPVRSIAYTNGMNNQPVLKVASSTDAAGPMYHVEGVNPFQQVDLRPGQDNRTPIQVRQFKQMIVNVVQ